MKRLTVVQEVEQVGARITENELERPAAAVAPLARQGLGATLPEAEAEPAHERGQGHGPSRRGSASWA